MCSRPEATSRLQRPRRLGPRHALCVFWGLTLGVAVGLAQEDDVNSAKATAQARVAAAESAQADGDRLRQHADYDAAEARDRNLTSTWQRAEQLLETARKAMVDAEAAPTANAYRDAGILANGSRRAFEDFAGRCRRVLQRIEAERAPPPPPPAEPEPSPVAEEPDPEPTVGDTAEGPASTPHDEASTDDSADNTAAKTPSTPSPSAPSAASPAPSTPPSQSQARPQLPALTSMAPTLRSAIEAYFRGDDEAVLQTLATPDALGSGVHKAHALMVRAAARYHLFLLGGERDHAQRSAAVDDVMACRRLVADLSPSRDLFSPRFVDFFSGIQLPEQR